VPKVGAVLDVGAALTMIKNYDGTVLVGSFKSNLTKYVLTVVPIGGAIVKLSAELS
jgi:hypothetical protein